MRARARARMGLYPDYGQDCETGGKAAGTDRRFGLAGHETAWEYARRESAVIDWDDGRERMRIPWSEDEDNIIRELSHHGATAEECEAEAEVPSQVQAVAQARTLEL